MNSRWSSFLLWLLVPAIAASDSIPWFTTEPQSAIVKPGTNVTLSCAAAPASAVVRWRFNGRPLTSNSEYEITANSLVIASFIRDRHGGTYHCVATSSAGSILSHPAILSTPSFGWFSTSTKDVTITLMEGETALLPCRAPDSSPPATISFRRDNALVPEDGRHHLMPSGSMQIAGIRKSEAGDYRCVARNPISGQERVSPARVKVIVKDPYLTPTPPRIIDKKQETVEAVLGGTVILECVARGSAPMKYTWGKYGGLLPADHTETFLGNLKITNVKLWDQGTYICTASNNRGNNAEKIVTVEVKAQPVVTIPNPNQVARLGATVNIQCDVMSKKPTSGIKWYHNAAPIRAGRQYSIRGNILSIKGVRPKHAGLYQCTTSSSEGHASARARIEISSGGSTNQSSHDDHINILTQPGNPVYLPCPSQKPVNWVHTEKPISSGRSKIFPNGSLSLVSARLEDSGIYKCSEKNGALLKTYHLTVQDRYGQSDGSTASAINKTNIPRDEQSKFDDNRRKGTRRNKSRKGSSVKLIPPSKPDVTKLSDTSVMLGWTVRDNDGLDITFFRIQYKEVRPHRGDWKTLDIDIPANKRKFEVSELTPGATYKFRIAAVYTNNDNEVGPNSDRFHLEQELATELKPPRTAPTVVQVESMIHEGIYALVVKWQYRPKEQTKITGFNLEYKPHYSHVDFSRMSLNEPGIRSFVIKNLKPDTSYDIRVNCFNEAGVAPYSNLVVKRTAGGPHTGSRFPESGKPPILEEGSHMGEGHDTTRATTVKSSVAYEAKNSTHSSNEMLYMVLGIVLGILMLLLVIFMVMCGIRQRQNRRLANDLITTKYQDPAQRIYSDNIDKYKNGGGGGFFLSQLNGAPNGHVSNGQQINGGGGGRGLNVSVNPLSEYDTHTQMTSPLNESEMAPRVMTPSLNPRSSDGTYNSIDGSHGSHTYTAAPTYSVLSPQPPPPLLSFGLNHRPIDPAPPPAPTHRSTPSSCNSPSYNGAIPSYGQTATPYAQSTIPHAHTEYDSDDSREFHSLMLRKNDRIGKNERIGGCEPPVYPPSTPPGARHNRRQPRSKPTPSHDPLNSMRDQATNTDISSSNEGTIDDSSLSRLHDYDSPSSSLPRRHRGDERSPQYSMRDSSDMEYRMLPQSQMQYQYDSDAMTDT